MVLVKKLDTLEGQVINSVVIISSIVDVELARKFPTLTQLCFWITIISAGALMWAKRLI